MGMTVAVVPWVVAVVPGVMGMTVAPGVVAVVPSVVAMTVVLWFVAAAIKYRFNW
jgi:hypothetical protein